MKCEEAEQEGERSKETKVKMNGGEEKRRMEKKSDKHQEKGEVERTERWWLVERRIKRVEEIVEKR